MANHAWANLRRVPFTTTLINERRQPDSYAVTGEYDERIVRIETYVGSLADGERVYRQTSVETSPQTQRAMADRLQRPTNKTLLLRYLKSGNTTELRLATNPEMLQRITSAFLTVGVEPTATNVASFAQGFARRFAVKAPEFPIEHLTQDTAAEVLGMDPWTHGHILRAFTQCFVNGMCRARR